MSDRLLDAGDLAELLNLPNSWVLKPAQSGLEALPAFWLIVGDDQPTEPERASKNAEDDESEHPTSFTLSPTGSYSTTVTSPWDSTYRFRRAPA